MKNGFWKGEVMVTLQELSEELKSYEVSIEIVTETLESIKESKAYKHIQTQTAGAKLQDKPTPSERMWIHASAKMDGIVEILEKRKSQLIREKDKFLHSNFESIEVVEEPETKEDKNRWVNILMGEHNVYD
tara:strand:- start:1622 stop:2014 length:393 start_codon:yes stop_codon:yes gene_type:complete